MRILSPIPVFPVLVFGLFAACSPKVPDSGAGVGFDTLGRSTVNPNPDSGQTINGDQLVPPAVVSSEIAIPPQSGTGWSNSTSQPVSPATAAPRPVQQAAPAQPAVRTAAATPAPVTAPRSSDDLARETAAALQAAQSNSGVAPVEASPSNPAPRLISNPGISDENDFGAVSNRETIESDAQRIARNRAQLQVVQPTALPSRSGSGQPNIVRYALSTSNPKGVRIYSRAGINMAARNRRNCATYGSADEAQIDFLARGGPQRDRQALDPDGDGYACGWDPAPFRKVAGN